MDTLTQPASITIASPEGPMTHAHPVVSREAWLEERRKLLAEEKALSRQIDALAAKRRALPWVRVAKDYRFETPDGTRTLDQLFGDASQLVVYHFMLGPGWEEGCAGCSFVGDHFDGPLRHVPHHDVAFTAVSRAPLTEIEAYKQRMGWKFPWISAIGSEFNIDFGVAFSAEQIARGEAMYNYEPAEDPEESDELPGLSCFYKDSQGNIFHTYSTYRRGLDRMLGAYVLLEMTAKGRNESGTMDWVRRNDRYGNE